MIGPSRSELGTGSRAAILLVVGAVMVLSGLFLTPRANADFGMPDTECGKSSLDTTVSPRKATVTCEHDGHEHFFDVPALVTRIHVHAVGGSAGLITVTGAGAIVEADLDVTPGDRLYLTVGGNAAFTGTSGSGAGDNGGGSQGYNGLAGGGATDIRTCTLTLFEPDSCDADDFGTAKDPRLVVAGGGGGGGLSSSPPNQRYSNDAGIPDATGYEGATQTRGGRSVQGGEGKPRKGGDGCLLARCGISSGGGGGYFGGGAGSGGIAGGGGSSFGPPGSTYALSTIFGPPSNPAALGLLSPVMVISYELPRRVVVPSPSATPTTSPTTAPSTAPSADPTSSPTTEPTATPTTPPVPGSPSATPTPAPSDPDAGSGGGGSGGSGDLGPDLPTTGFPMWPFVAGGLVVLAGGSVLMVSGQDRR